MSQEDVREKIGYLIKQTQQAFHRGCEERLRPLGLSMSQYAVLRAVADIGPAPAAELARRTFVTRQSLRDVLSGLLGADLVTIADAPTIGRALPVTLTPGGRSLLDRADAIVFDVEARMLTGIPSKDVRRLASLLTTCLGNLG
ncbi:MarR family winged helix-turn-helix transcriptional regulator [Nocardia terpenica]|uniref:MarR family transcriptional regulator n=1 Tax=Nocardia terpenica TaxID=455432 RepID=A0A6G9Z2P7_9NOCA|nr:MarR family transcriptional regulator [Nocardia terpenica]QIS19752.1 MarR family transcriptional regulator [Nocardia terpenica]